MRNGAKWLKKDLNPQKMFGYRRCATDPLPPMLLSKYFKTLPNLIPIPNRKRSDSSLYRDNGLFLVNFLKLRNHEYKSSIVANIKVFLYSDLKGDIRDFLLVDTGKSALSSIVLLMAWSPRSQLDLACLIFAGGYFILFIYTPLFNLIASFIR